jgi:hypothetical protein
MTRSEITRHAIKELEARGARVRQVHNVPVKRRKNHVQPGWPDIQGYTKMGLAVLCEVKTENDRLSIHQVARLSDGVRCGCSCLVATVNEVGGFVLIPYNDFVIKTLSKQIKQFKL